MNLVRKLAPLAVATGVLVSLTGCHTDMWKQAKIHKPLQESDFFNDKQSARPLVAGTVPTNTAGDMRTDNPLYTGMSNGKLVDAIPASVLTPFEVKNNGSVDAAATRKAMLLRGQERYNIYCQPCHGAAGDGKGIIAERGFAQRRAPQSYHTDRLRTMPAGHFYGVITNGFGTMYSYSSRINDPRDRWAIVAYIRVLQQNQAGKTGQAPAQQGETVNGQTAPAAHEAGH